MKKQKKKLFGSDVVDKVIQNVQRIQEWQKAPERAEKAFMSGDKEEFERAKADYNSPLSKALMRQEKDKKKKKKDPNA